MSLQNSLDNVSAIEHNISIGQRIIKIVKIANDKVPFIEWMNSLDKTTKARGGGGQSRLTRLFENNFGDHKKIDNEISEFRLKLGSGYRIYYTEINNIVVLLINDGNKLTQ